MNNDNAPISREEALRQVNLALRRAALIYHYFSETVVTELGENRGLELIRKAVDAYGAHVGREAREKVTGMGRELTPENFPSDLPETAWKTERVTVEGEERVRVHDCPLAREWLEWGDSKKSRLYCFVDQAKIKEYNPDYEYVHIKNLLDGDPYCELAVRQVKPAGDAEETGKEDSAPETVQWVYGKYSRKDLMRMDPVCLRALFRERIHHTIEVDIYPMLLGRKKLKRNFGRQPRLILDVWRERDFSDSDPDFEWGKQYLEWARMLQAGGKIDFAMEELRPFSDQEMEAVRKLLWRRHSIRDWLPGKEIPDEMIEQVLEAGRAAPNACNLEIVRFVIIKDPQEAKMVWSDIPTPMDRCVLIVICYDKRVYESVGHNRLVPHNQLFDCAAAGDHMCLMAHALGLGAVWLTRTEKTGQAFKEKFGLPDHIEPAMHVALGWPAMGTLKSGRMPLEEMIIRGRTQTNPL